MANLVLSGDTSGSVTLSAPAVAGSTTLTLPATSGTILQSGTVVTEAQGGTGTTTGYYGFKNRIINGAMVIDQRWAGGNVTDSTATNPFLVDRWSFYGNVASKVSLQQNQGSVTPPAGFANYMGMTVTSAYSPAAGDAFRFQQTIEGYNTADLAWGTSNAKAVTLSFWVRSSLTGTFSGALSNSALDRSYPFTFSIPSANTWTQVSVTIPGCTDGTWLTTNGIGVRVFFNAGCGSTSLGTAGAWGNAFYAGATGSVAVVSNASATFQFTGVQLEKGSTATSFDYRPYGTELQLCQRYYEKSFAQGTAPAEGVDNNFQTGGVGYAGNGLYLPNISFKVTKRTTATVTIFRPNVVATNGNFAVYNATTGAWNSSTTTVNSANDTTFSCNLTSNITQDKGYAILGAWTASAEL